MFSKKSLPLWQVFRCEFGAKIWLVEKRTFETCLENANQTRDKRFLDL